MSIRGKTAMDRAHTYLGCTMENDDSHVLVRDLAAQNAGLLAPLIEAKRTIQALHGKTAWDIYDAHSPEMKKINAALNSTA